jgi:molybdate transport system substrate-binding protein
MPRPVRHLLVLSTVFGLLVAACGDDASSGTAPGDEITVFAAASLSDSFTEIGKAFEAANPGAKVTFSFAASSELVQQINDGAPADVYASADQANMQKLTGAANAAGEPEVFATNELEIITGAGNPKRVSDVADLGHPDLIVVTCGPDVPIGKYTTDLFEKAGVDVTPKSYEADVKAIVSKVTLGEADAGIVYATDVKAAGDKAAGVEIPDELNVVATYPIAVTKAAKNVGTADAFVAFVLGEAGQQILAAAGFSAP